MDLSELEGELAQCHACHLRNDAIAPVGWYHSNLNKVRKIRLNQYFSDFLDAIS